MIKEEQIIKQLREVIDPELNVNIVDLGLIYGVKIYPSSEAKRSREVKRLNSSRPRQTRLRTITNTEDYSDVEITMTLTTPGCPLSYVFEAWIPEAVKKIKGVKNVYINLVWEPAWDPEKMSDEARESLGIIK